MNTTRNIQKKKKKTFKFQSIEWTSAHIQIDSWEQLRRIGTLILTVCLDVIQLGILLNQLPAV